MLLLIDDELSMLRPWINRLKLAKYSVRIRNRAEQVVAQAAELMGQGLQAAIIDVKMPAPADWGVATMGGLATGLVVADRFRAVSPRLPIIFLTNHRNAAIQEKIQNYPQPSMYLDKREVTPAAFIEAVKNFVGAPVASIAPEDPGDEE